MDRETAIEVGNGAYGTRSISATVSAFAQCLHRAAGRYRESRAASNRFCVIPSWCGNLVDKWA
jgi:hypothetical protein